jgi:hypothetical protein
MSACRMRVRIPHRRTGGPLGGPWLGVDQGWVSGEMQIRKCRRRMVFPVFQREGDEKCSPQR